MARTVRPETVVARIRPELVEAHAPVHAQLGHAGEVGPCVDRLVKHAKQLATQNYKPHPAMGFETFLTRVLRQAVGPAGNLRR